MAYKEPFMPGHIVVSTAGRDRGRYYIVIDVTDDRYVWLADGISRTTRKPKRKNVRHLQVVAPPDERFPGPPARSRTVNNEFIRTLLRKYGAESIAKKASIEGG